MKLLLDAGHGGIDPGAIGYGYKEKDLNESDVYGMLSYQKIFFPKTIVNTTFNSLDNWTLDDRVEYTTFMNPDWFLSIHHNAGGGEGGEIFIHDYAMDITEQMANILDKALYCVYTLYDMKWRGVKRSNFSVLTTPGVSCFLLEVDFMDSLTDREKYRNSDFRYKLYEVLWRCFTSGRQYKI